MTQAPAFRLRQLRREFAGRTLLDIPELEFAAGEVSALVGPNGAGKTTLLRILALLDPPGSGTLEFQGEPAAWSGPRWLELRRRITLVLQAPFLFRGTVAQNVAFGLRVRGEPPAAGARRVAETLKLVDLAGFEDRPTSSLSGGEAQRVALARALVIEPQVLLLDEPTANVDANRIARLPALIAEINLRLHTTVIFSTHDLSQAFRLTSRVIHLVAGRVADFGHENIFSGTVEREQGRSWITVRGGLRIMIGEPAAGHVTCSIPAEAIHLHPARGQPPAAGNCFEGVITRMESSNGRVRLRVDGPASFRVVLPNEELQRSELRLCDRVLLSFAPEVVKILEAKT
jgi:tungstate transport system ATP-binding protein